MATQRSDTSSRRFGDLLRHLRVARGVTQELLAERTGLSVRGISDLERGARNAPQRETILRLVAGLELSGDEQAILWSAARRTPHPRGLPGATHPRQTADGLAAPGAFVGRAAELTAILLALYDPGHRLLTLTGPPGVGKTRLALEAVQRLETLAAAEIAFVDLAPIRNPVLVLPAIAAAVGLPETETELRERLLARLAARPVLLLLDNIEHLLAAAPRIADLLQISDVARFLVTSREPLRIHGEHVLPVLPLPTPRLTADVQVRDLIANDAVTLFVVRARESDPLFRLTQENAGAIAELCVRVDGLPLALELAAARVTSIGPEAIVQRLTERRPVLTAGRRELPERQRTLADAIDWSYDLLSPTEQQAFRWCSVFLGGFTPEAVETIADRLGDRGVRGQLESLAGKNLLVRQRGRADRVRFTMLETIREYGLDRLAALGEESLARDAHAMYFLSVAEHAERDFCTGRSQRAAIERLADDHDNLRQALAWLKDQTDPAPFLRLSGALWRFWSIHGHSTEGRRWLDRALMRSETAPPALKAKILIAIARLAWVRGEFAAAIEQLEQVLALDPAPFDRCEALNALGDVAREERDFDRAETALTEAIAWGRAHEDWFHLGASLHNLGIVELERGDHDRARALLEEGLSLARGMHNQYLAYSALHYLSRQAFEQGDFARAVILRREDLAVQRALAPLNAHGAARFFEGIALLALIENQPASAALFFGAAEMRREEAEDIERAERLQLAPWVAAARKALGDALFLRQRESGRSLSIELALREAEVLLDEWHEDPSSSHDRKPSPVAHPID